MCVSLQTHGRLTPTFSRFFFFAQVTPPAQGLSVNGQTLAHANGHAWVNVSLLKAGKDSIQDRDITNWITHNYEKAVQQAGEVYGGKITVTPVQCVVAGQGAERVRVAEEGPRLRLRGGLG